MLQLTVHRFEYSLGVERRAVLASCYGKISLSCLFKNRIYLYMLAQYRKQPKKLVVRWGSRGPAPHPALEGKVLRPPVNACLCEKETMDCIRDSGGDLEKMQAPVLLIKNVRNPPGPPLRN